jgi:hypothetical protein
MNPILLQLHYMFLFVVCFLLGNSQTSGFYILTFRNTLSVSSFITTPPMKMEHTECSETSEYKIQTTRNYPEESIQHSERGESFKSSKLFLEQPEEFSY